MRAWVFLTFGLMSISVARSTGLSILISVGALLLVTVLAGAILGRSVLVGVTATRRFSADVVHPGDLVTVQIEFTVTGRSSRRPMTGSWYQGVPFGVHYSQAYEVVKEGTPARGSITAVAGRPDSWWFSVLALRRGVFEFGPLIATATDPFGMVKISHTLIAPADLVAVPRPIEVPDFDQARTALRSMPHEGAGRGSGSTEDALVREYRVGDPMRRVHWRQTASKGELMVRQDEHAEVAGALVLLDTRLVRYPEATGFDDTAPTLFAGALAISEDFERVVVLAGSALAALEARNAPFAVATTAAAPAPAPTAASRAATAGEPGRATTPHGEVAHTGTHAYDGRSRSGEVALAAAFRDLAALQPSARETGAFDSAGTWAVDASALVVVGATFDATDAHRLLDGAPGFDSATVLTVHALGPAAAALFAEAGWRTLVDPDKAGGVDEWASEHVADGSRAADPATSGRGGAR